VYTYRYSGIIHSYTLEFGFHSSLNFNKIEPESNSNYVLESGSSKHPLIWKEETIEDQEKFGYTPEHYVSEGIAVLVSILDSLEINPYSRIPNT
jgi:hypothetical protein